MHLAKERIGGSYAKYVLLIMVCVHMLNLIDRQILSILSEEIKADLGVTDAQLGFLYGTSFAAFYAIFGLPIGRLADSWIRKNIIAVGLSFWSVMTSRWSARVDFGSLGTFWYSFNTKFCPCSFALYIRWCALVCASPGSS